MNDNSELRRWYPLELQIKEIYFDSMIDESEKLTVKFSLNSEEKYLAFDFGYSVIFYQKLSETVALKFLDNYSPEIFQNPFFY